MVRTKQTARNNPKAPKFGEPGFNPETSSTPNSGSAGKPAPKTVSRIDGKAVAAKRKRSMTKRSDKYTFGPGIKRIVKSVDPNLKLSKGVKYQLIDMGEMSLDKLVNIIFDLLRASKKKTIAYHTVRNAVNLIIKRKDLRDPCLVEMDKCMIEVNKIRAEQEKPLLSWSVSNPMLHRHSGGKSSSSSKK